MMTESEREEVELAKVAAAAWDASRKAATGTARGRQATRWLAVVRVILAAERNQRALKEEATDV